MLSPRSKTTLPCFFKASTPTELATEAGIDPDGLERTIEAFNRGRAAGEDQFGRRHMPSAIENTTLLRRAAAELVVVELRGRCSRWSTPRHPPGWNANRQSVRCRGNYWARVN